MQICQILPVEVMDKIPSKRQWQEHDYFFLFKIIYSHKYFLRYSLRDTYYYLKIV
jgi:hypothetical protein